MSKTLEIKKVLGGVEDLLLDATDPRTVKQTRAGEKVDITKISIETLPAAGKYGESGFKSIKSYIDDATDLGASVEVVNGNGGFVLAVGADDLDWTGGAPGEDQITLAQKLGNGKYRWLGIATIGSDNWKFRGRVSGANGTSDSDFVTKSQLDAVEDKAEAGANVQSDWDATSGDAFIKNKPDFEDTQRPGGTLSQLEEGTDEELRAWTAKDLKDFSQTLSGGAAANGLLLRAHETEVAKKVTLPVDLRELTMKTTFLYIPDSDGDVRVRKHGGDADACFDVKHNGDTIKESTKEYTVTNVKAGDWLEFYCIEDPEGSGIADLKFYIENP